MGGPSPARSLENVHGPIALNGIRQSRKAESEPRVGVWSGRRRTNPLWETAQSGFRVIDSNTLGGWWLTLKNVFGFFH